MEGAGIILLLFILAIYFLPSICAVGKRGAAGIFVLNLFLGWTLVGWVVALSWALAAPKADEPVGVVVEGHRGATPDSDTLLIRVWPDEKFAAAWQSVRPGPVRITPNDGGWLLETEDGPLAEVKPEGSKKISFRAETVGKPRGRITEVGPPHGQYVLVQIGFG